MKKLTKETAIENIKKIFLHCSEDSISLQDAFIAWGRDPAKIVKNKAWLSNRLTHLKYHNLVKPVYVWKNNRRVLDKLELTMEGKKHLGRLNEIAPIPTHATTVSFTDVMKIISRFRQENPEYQITFDIKLKDN